MPDQGVWFAESTQEGDERIETTGREIPEKTTKDSPAKSKRDKDE